MISMIIGNKGSGKTKRLVELVNAAVDASKGNVVCIEKGLKLTYDLTHKAWHTEVELTTDANGEVEFRGFYGDYEIEVDGNTAEISNHRDGKVQNVTV